jgi:hypothetical protein
MSKKEQKIYERNPDTGEVRSRNKGDYGNEKTLQSVANEMLEPMHYDIQHRVRKEVLEELWAANKVNHQGHWYVRLTDVVKIVGDYDELYENESRS